MLEEVLTYRMLTGKIELFPDAICYRGKFYTYSSVVHLGRFARRTSIYFIPIEDFLRLKIYIDGIKKPITVQNSMGVIFTTSRLKTIYERLVEKTFQQRVKSYLKQLEGKGFFEYGGAKFFPTGDVLIGNQKINVRTAKVWLEPFKFVLKEPTGFFARKRRISTDIDQDVFLALLKEIYGIKFGN